MNTAKVERLQQGKKSVWESIIEPESPKHPLILVRKNPGTMRFEAEFAAELQGVAIRQHGPDGPEKDQITRSHKSSELLL